MASSSKKKTTMAKLMRESKLRERRLDKQARKDARKRLSAEGGDGLAESPFATGAESPFATGDATGNESSEPGEAQPAPPAGVAPTLADV
jgi:hypothetical protein